jgi:Helix-turn-helix domain
MSDQRYACDDVLTVEEVAERLKVPQKTIYGLRDCPRFRVGRESRYLWGDVLEYLKGRSTSTTPTPLSASSRRGTVHEFRRSRGVK